MKILLRPCLLAALSLLALNCVRAQTVLVNLDFDNSDDRLAQTGLADITFSPSLGTVTYGAGVDGGTAAVFDGESSLQASGTPVTTALTVAFWMKTTTDNGLGGGSQWYEGAGLVDGELGGDTTDWGVSQLGTRLAFGIGSSDRTIFSSSDINTGNWIHVAVTWNTSGVMNLYLNGILEATDTLASSDPRDTTNRFFVGQDLGGNAFAGSLDQIRIFDSVLTGEQITTLAAVPEPSTSALLAAGVLGLALLRRRQASIAPSALRDLRG